MCYYRRVELIKIGDILEFLLILRKEKENYINEWIMISKF